MFPEDFQWDVVCFGRHPFSLSPTADDVSSWCLGLNNGCIFAHRNDVVRMYNLSVPTFWTFNLNCEWLFGLDFGKNLYVHATFALPDCDFPNHQSPFDKLGNYGPFMRTGQSRPLIALRAERWIDAGLRRTIFVAIVQHCSKD